MFATEYATHVKRLKGIAKDHSRLSGMQYRVISARTRTDDQSMVVEYLCDNVPYVFKILIGDTHLGQKLEVAIANFMSMRFCLTDRVPGVQMVVLVGRGDDFKKLITFDSSHCPSLEDSFLGDHAVGPRTLTKCQLVGKTNVTGIRADHDYYRASFESTSPGYYLIGMLPGHPYAQFIDDIFIRYSEFLRTDPDSVAIVLHELDCTLFQVIFTLAVIQQDYPGFIHGDLSPGNLLVNSIPTKEESSLAYHYGDKVWHHPVSRPIASMIDFAQSVILPGADHSDDTTEYSDVSASDRSGTVIDQVTPYDNVWWFLKEVYQRMRGNHQQARYPNRIARPVMERVERLLDMDIIRKMDEYGSHYRILEQGFSLKQFPKITKTAKTPQEYLSGGYFDHLLRPEDSDVRVYARFNHPDGPLPFTPGVSS